MTLKDLLSSNLECVRITPLENMNKLKSLVPVLLQSMLACECPATPDEGVSNVKSFGVTGDGVTLDTQAIQKAIDACSENKGGTVWVPPGNYPMGTID